MPSHVVDWVRRKQGVAGVANLDAILAQLLCCALRNIVWNKLITVSTKK